MRRAIFGLLAVLLGFLAALTWYGCQHGFSKKWRTYLAQQFHRQGLEVSVRRLTLDPFRGLVAHEMKVYDPNNRHRVLAMIDQANLGVNYARVIRGKALLDSVDLRDAHVSLPLDPGDLRGANANVSHLSARIFFPPRQIYLSHAEAQIYGVQVFATGRVMKPQEIFFGGKERYSPGALLAGAAIELKTMRFEGAHPVIQIEFSGDLESPEKLSACIRLHATAMRRKKYLLQRLDVVATSRDGVAEIQQFDAEDGRGELHARGTYVFASHQFEGSVRSSLDLQALNGAWGLFRHPEVLLRDPPRVEVTVQGSLERKLHLCAVGHLGLGNFEVKSEAFTGLSADASWDGEQWSVRDLHLTHHSGSLSGDAVQQAQGFHAALHGSIDPKAFLPLLSGKPVEWLRQFEFNGTPAIEFKMEGPSLSSEQCKGSGKIQFGSAEFRNSPVSAVSELTYDDQALSLSPFSAIQEPGGIIFDFKRGEVRPAPAKPAPSGTEDALL